ncbi:hypothetical protein BGZ57DRAFT_907988 [Hyaloscypha finlandica]|nr:hypothetical protein BGZ57DRAFT_907988 [Hyaloscypha finlandica]
MVRDLLSVTDTAFEFPSQGLTLVTCRTKTQQHYEGSVMLVHIRDGQDLRCVDRATCLNYNYQITNYTNEKQTNNSQTNLQCCTRPPIRPSTKQLLFITTPVPVSSCVSTPISTPAVMAISLTASLAASITTSLEPRLVILIALSVWLGVSISIIAIRPS